MQRALLQPPPRYQRINEVTYEDEVTRLYLDVIPVQDKAQRAVFEGARLTPLHGAGGVRVLTAEGLAVMLLREATRDPRQKLRRLADIQEMARIGPLDWSYVRSWAEEMGYHGAYRDLEVPGKPPL